VFKFDDQYEENEEKYKQIRKTILDEASGDDEDSSSSDEEKKDDVDDEDEEEQVDEAESKFYERVFFSNSKIIGSLSRRQAADYSRSNGNQFGHTTPHNLFDNSIGCRRRRMCT
jgi:hypothetical protein